VVDDVIHYTVDNTPGMFPITITKVLSEGISRYIDFIIEGDVNSFPNNLRAAVVIEDGHIRDERITVFRMARNEFCK
jgi:N5-(carboxyethyl)ornithine synthase